MDLAEELTIEAGWAEAAVHHGPHCLIWQPDMRLFWWRTFGSQEEVTWDVFWSRFPKDLTRQFNPTVSLLLQSVCHSMPAPFGSSRQISQGVIGPHGTMVMTCIHSVWPGE